MFIVITLLDQTTNKEMKFLPKRVSSAAECLFKKRYYYNWWAVGEECNSNNKNGTECLLARLCWREQEDDLNETTGLVQYLARKYFQFKSPQFKLSSWSYFRQGFLHLFVFNNPRGAKRMSVWRLRLLQKLSTSPSRCKPVHLQPFHFPWKFTKKVKANNKIRSKNTAVAHS